MASKINEVLCLVPLKQRNKFINLQMISWFSKISFRWSSRIVCRSLFFKWDWTLKRKTEISVANFSRFQKCVTKIACLMVYPVHWSKWINAQELCALRSALLYSNYRTNISKKKKKKLFVRMEGANNAGIVCIIKLWMEGNEWSGGRHSNEYNNEDHVKQERERDCDRIHTYRGRSFAAWSNTFICARLNVRHSKYDWFGGDAAAVVAAVSGSRIRHSHTRAHWPI